MSYDFAEAKEVIKATLGDNYALVSSKMDKVFDVATSQRNDLANVTNESMKRKGKIAELEINHKTELSDYQSKVSDYDELVKNAEALKTQLTEKETQLKGFYDGKRADLKEISKKYDFSDEKNSGLKSMFPDIDKIDEFGISKIEQYTRDFKLVEFNKAEESNPNPPNPNNKQKNDKNKESMFNYDS